MLVIAAITLTTLLNWLQVAVGLGLVIFVHELGHFAVAKMCGVKCEKFYLGFDIGGLKLFKFQWGETEYGIGILPLGGYVKMLGQEDNPAKAAEENQRAKVHDAPPPPVEGWAADRTEESESIEYDPRSYLAQSVPKRMAIISAGVIMNLIFAVIMATVAYLIGVPYMPAVVSGLVPGQPAWNAGLQVGDEILSINNVQKPRYTDLMATVALSDLDKGVRMTVVRDDDPPFEVVLHPTLSMGIPKVGIMRPRSLRLHGEFPAWPYSPAADASPPLMGNDLIVAIDGQAVNNVAQLDRLLAVARDRSIEVRVQRGGSTGRGAADGPVEEVTVSVAANPVRHYGLQMAMGPLVAVQQGSPAEQAGFQVGDLIVAINGEAAGDPLSLPDRLYDRAGEEVTFTVERGDGARRDVTVVLPEPTDISWPAVEIPKVPRAVSGLGIAYPILNEVTAVEPGSSAAQAEIQPGNIVAKGVLVVPKQTDEQREANPLDRGTPPEVEFDAATHNWVYLMDMAQRMPPGTKLKLTLGDDREVELEPMMADDWFNADRGFLLDGIWAERRAENLQQALAMGGRETLDWTLQVYRFLQKLGRQIPITELGGPGAIVGTASAAAHAGFSQFLIFLVMLSANLAVLNFLPIPMLDGGHMVFLILEGIRRKPVSEKVVLAFHYAGFLFIVTLMCFVLFLDIRRFLL